ncbi:MAG: hypothetical protein MUC36_25110 [Planctomycetes bacterium]|jgi:hypothetical protein|nr:hypothetical protein [Planctomycetota bacterium]
MQTTRLLTLVPLLAPALLAQQGVIPGLDGSLTNNASPTYFGRRGPAHPNGQIAMAMSYSMCNPGTVPIQWTAPMNPNHPMFAMMVVRESNGRLEQLTNETETYVKHAFSAANSASTCGGTCQATGSGLRVNCTDVYGAGLNANRFYLGPANEIDPWTGTWNPIGSYFDRGDPAVAPPQNTDGVRSLTSGTTGVFTDPVRNRIALKEQDLLVPGRLFYCCHIICKGEDGDLHWNNLGHREMTASWNGSTWSFGLPNSFVSGSVLNAWAGATVSNGRNGDDDGHFVVAVKTTALGGGLWHYEYALQNFDNHRGGATLRIPVNPTTPVTNLSFRDPNDDPLDGWIASRQGAELVFTAPANNPLNWNNIYNFGFDCDVPPIAGNVVVDQARLGAGALSVTIGTRVPAGLAAVTALGVGCGAPAPVLATNGLPVIPNAGFAFTVAATPFAPVIVYGAAGAAATLLAPGCTLYLDNPVVTHGVHTANAAGQVLSPLAIPNSPALEGTRLAWQAVEVTAGGPVFGFLALSNGIETLVAVR